MFLRLLLVLTLISLSACVTKQKLCIREAIKNYLPVKMAIDKKEANLQRGYAVHEQVKSVIVPADCYTESGRQYQCVDTDYQTIEIPVTVDMAHERKTLKALKAREKKLYPAALAAVGECRRRFPSSEGAR